MKHTVIALFEDDSQARQAADALARQGFDRGTVHLTQGSDAPDIEPLPAAVEIEGGPASGLLHRLAMLFGVEEPHVAHYVEGVQRGGSVVTVGAADEAQAVAARDALLAQGAVNIDDRVSEWRQAGWEGSAAPGTEGSAAPTMVHRQEVSIGGVRVYGQAAGNAYEEFAAEFRADYIARYEGSAYEDFEPAYRHGLALASDSRHDGLDWDDIELDARAQWERRHPQRTWERYKGAVQHAWERVKWR